MSSIYRTVRRTLGRPFLKPYLATLTAARILKNAWPDRECMRLLWKVRPHTMVGEDGLVSLYGLAQEAEREKIPGAFVECGVWKGGCAALLAYAAHHAGNRRPVWLFDSFEGVPEPTEVDGAEAMGLAGRPVSGKLSPIGHYVGAEADVRRILFDTLRLPPENIHIVRGWFQDTVPRTAVGPIALLRLDGDWYESTKVCLDNLYDRVVPGGWVVIDDYGHWEGCKKAVDEFLVARGIPAGLRRVNYTIHYFRKPTEVAR